MNEKMTYPRLRPQTLISTFCFIFFIVTAALSQTNDEYQLLWKIEGEAVGSPSYLFGTMHVDDARVFNFSDAVLPAIESARYFALEVNPDSLMIAFTSKTYDITASEYYKKLLSPKDYQRLLKRFKEVNDFSLEDSEIRSPEAVLTMLVPDMDKEDDKSTFVDMYLLGHARTMQKEIVGLEDISTQMNFFENLDDDKKITEVLSSLDVSIDSIKNMKEIMTKIYATGNLDKIHEFVENNYKDGIYSDMTSRNRVMAKSIIEYMKTGSIFAGVGAAHLVGKENVIELLQNAGYKVSAVEARFTGVADTYKIDPSNGEWYTYIDDEMGYYLEIPRAPNVREESSNFTVKGYSDTTTGTNYLFMSIDLGYQLSEADQEALLQKMVENINDKRQGEILEMTKIDSDEFYGYDVVGALPDNQLIKSKYIVKNHLFYYFSAETDAEQIEENYVTRFLKSIIVKGVEKSTDAIGWREFESTVGAFKIEIPVEAKDVSREIPNPHNPEDDPYYLNMYMAAHTAERDNYLFRYNDQPLGYYVSEPEAAFDEMKTTLTQKSTLLSEPKVIYLDELEGREYELSLNNKYHSIARVYFRGNRTYLLLKQKLSTNEKISSDDPFFTSFKLLPYEEPNIKTYSPSDESFTINWFDKTSESIDSEEYNNLQIKDSHDYTSVNPKSGGVYQFGYHEIKKYFRTSSYKAFLDDYKNGDIIYNDSIIKQEIKVVKGDSVVQFAIKKKNAMNVKSQTVTRIWINNNKVQFARALVSDEEANSPLVEKIFNSVIMKPAEETIDIFRSKAALIIEDLKSEDSTTYRTALNAFNYYEFEDDELPLLQKAFNYNFPEDRIAEIKATLIDEFIYLDDPSSIGILEDYYRSEDLSDELKSSVLVAISKLESEDNLNIYNDLLFSNPPKLRDSYDYRLLSPFEDSLQYAKVHYKKLLNLMPYVQYRKDILNIATDLYNSDLNAKDMVSENEAQLLEYLKADYDNFKIESNKEDEVDYIYENTLFAYLKLLNNYKCNNEAFDAISEELVNNDTQKWLKLQAVTARLFNEYSFPKEQLDALIDNLYYRFEIMEVFHKLNKLSTINKRYLKPEAFAKLSFYNNVGEEEGYPDFITIEKKIKRNDAIFYVVKFGFEAEKTDSEDSAYIGIVGPINKISQENPMKMFDALSYWNTFDANWETEAENLINEYLEAAD